MVMEKYLLFRTNLNLELFETNAVSEKLIRDYNELGFISANGKKDYFEFFYWASKYLILNNENLILDNDDYEVFKGIVNSYKTVNAISDKDEEFILYSFKINELISKAEKYTVDEAVSLIDNALSMCLDLDVSDSKSLLILQRLKLRYLLHNIADMNSARAAELNVVKDEVEKLLAEQESETQKYKETKQENVCMNSIFAG